ncbi:MAG: OmpP1/FadL family transporter [Lactobacillaceae bacterium]|jgi:long-chain fatty acid transport protein|nr:OmpP1/FadL family transporter [Lactobacillaceae bacterium]
MKKLLTLTAIGVVLASNAYSSGFHLKEQSVSALGNAFAGATAGAEDISYSYFNPAGITRHKGSQVVFGTTYVAPKSKVSNVSAGIPSAPGDSNPGGWIPDTNLQGKDIIKNAAIPNFYASKQLNEDFTIAMALNSPIGMITKYDNSWAGRLHGTLSNVKTYTFTPTVAYKVDEKVSIAAGLQIQHITARLRNAVNVGAGPVTGRAALEGEATDLGYVLGVMYEYSDKTRFGLGYRSRIKHKLKGDLDVYAPSGTPLVYGRDINARITTPALLSIGAYHDVNDKWSVMAELQRTYWETFKELRIYNDAGGVASQTDEMWKNTMFYAVGTSYKINDQWKVKAGLGFDKSAVKKQFKTPRVPDSDRNWYSLGAQYAYSENLAFDFGYTFIKAKKGKVILNGLTPGDVAGGRGSIDAQYDSKVHIFGAAVTYKF